MTAPGPKPDKPSKGDHREAQLTDSLKRLALDDGSAGWHLGARLRNAFLTGLVIVGPVTITLYIMFWLINWVDALVKPLLPAHYNPDTYLPFPIPGIGLLVGIIGLTIIGSLAANLLGRSLVSTGELMLGQMPIVRNVYSAIKQIFESVVTNAGPNQSFQKVGLIEFPSEGIWSLVFVTGETTGEIVDVKPGDEDDLLTVFMPTGIVPPTGFICFVPRKNVILLSMSAEEAAKVILSGGIVMPGVQDKLKEMSGKEVAARAVRPSYFSGRPSNS